MNKLNSKWKIKNYVTYYYIERLESLYVFLCYKLYIYIVKLLYSIPTATTVQLCIEYENKTKYKQINLRSRQPGVRSFGEREITVLICSQNPCRLWLVFVYYILIFDLLHMCILWELASRRLCTNILLYFVYTAYYTTYPITRGTR